MCCCWCTSIDSISIDTKRYAATSACWGFLLSFRRFITANGHLRSFTFSCRIHETGKCSYYNILLSQVWTFSLGVYGWDNRSFTNHLGLVFKLVKILYMANVGSFYLYCCNIICLRHLNAASILEHPLYSSYQINSCTSKLVKAKEF